MKNINLILLFQFIMKVKLIKLLKLIKIKLKKDKFNIILCYDNKKDNVFNYLAEIKNSKPIYFSKNVIWSCTAVINGLKKSKSVCKIVYPADDFMNIPLISKMHNYKIK